jgi:hypothetical protein
LFQDFRSTPRAPGYCRRLRLQRQRLPTGARVVLRCVIHASSPPSNFCGASSPTRAFRVSWLAPMWTRLICTIYNHILRHVPRHTTPCPQRTHKYAHARRHAALLPCGATRGCLRYREKILDGRQMVVVHTPRAAAAIPSRFRAPRTHAICTAEGSRPTEARRASRRLDQCRPTGRPRTVAPRLP